MAGIALAPDGYSFRSVAFFRSSFLTSSDMAPHFWEHMLIQNNDYQPAGRTPQSPQPQNTSCHIIYLNIKEWNWRTWQDDFERVQIERMEFENTAHETGEKWECYRKGNVLVYFLVVYSTNTIFLWE